MYFVFNTNLQELFLSPGATPKFENRSSYHPVPLTLHNKNEQKFQ